ncbi:MAG: DNA polymerase III subunit delta [Bacilli bacterium]|nr:DNA polymerase III subunit delta [Bacilli bacterium]
MNNIYLIASNSYRLLEDELNKILKDNVYSSFDLLGIDIEEVLEEASYVSLFDEKKYMVVKNANIFCAGRKKEAEEDSVSKKDETLLKYLEQPNENTVLIFVVNGKIDGKKKICKIIKDRYNLIQIDDLKPKEIYNNVDKIMKKEGYKLDYDTIYYIINSCLNNYDLVMNELDKIKLYYGKGCNVKYEDVVKIVSHGVEDNNFKFIDAVIGKNIKEAFKIYDDLMLQKVEPIMLMSMIAKEIRNTLLVKKMIKSYDKKEIMKKLGINFDFQIDKLINNSYSFSEKKLEEYLVYLCDMDYKIKRGKISNKLALELFILEICK